MSSKASLTEFRLSPIGQAFFEDPSFVRAIMGPVGSGKSALCVNVIWDLINGQPQSRHAVIRNTYRELQDTTLNTWMDWLRPYGEFKHSTMTHYLRFGDQTAEVLFRALDKPSDVGKLLSLELTSAWCNEVREIPRAIVDMIQTRIGRYPPMRDGGPKRSCLIMDTNPPDDLSWFYRVFEEQKPSGYKLFRQPGAFEDGAENKHNLIPEYYDRLVLGKDDAWIDVYVNGNYGFIVDGKPVYPQYNDKVHCASTNLAPLDTQVVVGIDFGLTPAATFKQMSASGQWQCSHEIVTEDMSAIEFAPLVRETLNSKYQGLPAVITGDPAGNQRSQADKSTPFQILRASGVKATPAPTNDPDIRQSAVVRHLQRMTMAGEPGYLISPACKYLRRGYMGGYKFRLLQVSGDERFSLEPDKNLYSHVCEADQYGFLGVGEGRIVVGSDQNDGPLDYSKLRRAVA